jgi:hypothetical protein
LRERAAVPHWTQEEALFATLPASIKAEIRRLLGLEPGGGAFGAIKALVKAGYSVQKAAKETRSERKLPGSLKRLRARYDLWTKRGDWVCLVNLSRAGAAWQAPREVLPGEFIRFCAARCGGFVRWDGKRQAILAIKRQWATGRDLHGERKPIPGYGFWPEWFRLKGHRILGLPPKPLPEPAWEPPGWSYVNILDQVSKHNALPQPVKALLLQGTAAARASIPQARGDRNSGGADGGPVRFLERVEFDDVKVDFLIIDPLTGQVCDLWLLIARDYGTGILLGFGLRPALVREDGSQVHLKLRDMKQLCGWILEHYGLPPYLMVWVLERGTAALPPGARAALRELLPGRIDFRCNQMIGGKSPNGFAQREIGNSKAKASLESHNRLEHTMSAWVPGQTGPLYDVRPMDLQARARDAADTWKLAQGLPPHLRGQMGYSVLTIGQAREHLHRVFCLQHARTEHEMQGFEQVAEWYDERRGLWLPQNQLTAEAVATGPGLRTRVRKESPLERCARLVAPYRDQWTAVSPDIITSFYSHTQRELRVQDNGLIEFSADGTRVEFMPAPDSPPLIPGTKLLGYYQPNDPAFLHLTDGAGRVVGTWLRRARAHDAESLSLAIRYSQHALKIARQTAEAYSADERARLAAIKAKNADLLAANTCVEVAAPVDAHSSPFSSPVARALVAVDSERDSSRAAAAARAGAAANAILAPAGECGVRNAECGMGSGDNLLSALAAPTGAEAKR